VVVTLGSSLAMAVLLAGAATGRQLVMAACVLPAAIAALFAVIQGNGFSAAVALWSAAAGLATFLLWRRRQEHGGAGAWAVAVMLMAVALPWSAVPMHARLKGEPAVIPLSEADLRPERVRLGLRRTAARDDYVPRTVQVMPARDAAQEYFPPAGATPPAMAEVVAGEARLTDLQRFSDGMALTVTAAAPCRLVLNLHDFPGMAATLATAAGSRVVSHTHADSGRVMLELPAGEGRVTVRLGRTPVRRLADSASLLGWLLLPVGMAGARFRRRPRSD